MNWKILDTYTKNNNQKFVQVIVTQKEECPACLGTGNGITGSGKPRFCLHCNSYNCHQCDNKGYWFKPLASLEIPINESINKNNIKEHIDGIIKSTLQPKRPVISKISTEFVGLTN
jgi:DnaJ-class molecular chaperone